MKKYKGIIIILLTFLITYITWLFETPTKQISIYRQYSQLIASISLIAVAWVNYISSRHRYVDKIFNGLDKSYIYHKFLSIIAVLFMWIHTSTLKMGGFSRDRSSEGGIPPQGFNPADKISENTNPSFFNFLFSGKQLGSLSMFLFVALVVLFIIASRLEYEKWKILHKLILVPYAFGVLHYYLSAEYNVFSFTPYSIWMNLINAIGLLSAIYSIFIYELTAFKYIYNVTNIRDVAKDTLEITGTSKNKPMKYKPGQFAFMKVTGKKNLFPSHPFTMSQSFKDEEIQFTIKALGDHTGNLKDNLSIGDTIAVSGPYGKFDYKSGLKRQVWLAGGIGITPFRTFWQTEIPDDFKIDFFYAYNNEKEGPYVDELKSLKTKNNLSIHLFDSSKSGFLEVKDFEKYLNKSEEYDLFFCGPIGMRKKIGKDLTKAMFKIRSFHYEHFKFK